MSFRYSVSSIILHNWSRAHRYGWRRKSTRCFLGFTNNIRSRLCYFLGFAWDRVLTVNSGWILVDSTLFSFLSSQLLSCNEPASLVSSVVLFVVVQYRCPSSQCKQMRRYPFRWIVLSLSLCYCVRIWQKKAFRTSIVGCNMNLTELETLHNTTSDTSSYDLRYRRWPNILK